MEIYLINTTNGLVPVDDESHEQKQKLKLGKIYKAKVTLSRSYEFHKRYMALIKCSWEYQNEKVRAFFKDDMHKFRKYIEVTAGHSESFYHPKIKDWVEVPKSISFDKTPQDEFRDLYDKVYIILFQTFLKHITQEEFEKNLKNF